MATLVLTSVGTLFGGPIGGALGAVVGQSVDALLFAPKARQGPRLGELAVQTSSYGTPIPKLFGRMRVAGTVIWASDLIERRTTSGGGKGRPKSVDYSYAANLAVALSARPVRAVRRIWADGKLLRGEAGDWKARTGFRLHLGDEDQEVDPLIAAAEGAGGAPAFRGIAYAVFEELELAEFGNRIPSLSFEVEADVGPVPIGGIAEELSGGRIVASASPGLLGYAASGDSVRGAVESLAELGQLALADTGEAMRLEAPGEAAPTLSRLREHGRRELVRQPAASMPGEVSITYHDAARDYQTGLQRAWAGGAVPEARAERRALPAVLAADAAKLFAERRLAALRAERVSATVRFAWAAAPVRPGMLVRLDGEPGLWRVRRWTLGAMQVKLEFVRHATGAAVGSEASPGRPVAEEDRPHGPTELRFIELPFGEPGLERPALTLLAAGPEAGWRQASLSLNFDGGGSWRDVGSTAAAGIFGTASTILPPGDAALFDLAGAVEVELLGVGMALESRDDDALVGGANLALIGEELVQFGRAKWLGGRRYRLSRLLRGRRGTEWAAGLHEAGESFTLIESATALPVELPAGFGIGAEALAMASGVGDGEAAEATLTVRGEALRPPSPVHLAAREASGGDRIIRWVRRSRQGWSWTSGSDAPLGEERELYRLTLSGAGWSRSVELGSAEYLYTAAARAADGAGPVTVEVEQIGTHGGSRGASITIS